MEILRLRRSLKHDFTIYKNNISLIVNKPLAIETPNTSNIIQSRQLIKNALQYGVQYVTIQYSIVVLLYNYALINVILGDRGRTGLGFDTTAMPRARILTFKTHLWTQDLILFTCTEQRIMD